MNVRLLRKVAKHISEEPRRFMMGDGIALGATVLDQIIFGLPRPVSMTLQPPCGTAACIAGWTCLLSGHKPEEFIKAGHCNFWGSGGVSLVAQQALSLTDDQTERLFHLANWPTRFRNAFSKAKTPRGRASAAVRNIEHFIKTKGKE